MITKEGIDKLVSFLNLRIKRKLGNRLESVYVVGSYTQGKISLSRPDINWLLVHKDSIQDDSRWKLGEILTEAIDKFIDDFVIRPEFRPFKFSYPAKRGQELFVNVSIVTNASSPDDFKKRNSFIPEYVFEGFKATRSLIFGKDILKGINFQVSKRSIHADAINKIASHKIQLDRIPLTYHLKRDIDLVFNESLSHGKNLLFFGVELLMSDKELKQRKFLDICGNHDKLLKFYKTRFPEVLDYVQEILEAKKNFENWKSKPDKVKSLYFASSAFAELLFNII
jgi:predicted nucleotidyltransferase